MKQSIIADTTGDHLHRAAEHGQTSLTMNSQGDVGDLEEAGN